MTGCNCLHCHGCRPIPKEMLKARLKLLKAQDKRIEKNIEKMIDEETVMMVIIKMGEYSDNSFIFLRKKGVFE